MVLTFSFGGTGKLIAVEGIPRTSESDTLVGHAKTTCRAKSSISAAGHQATRLKAGMGTTLWTVWRQPGHAQWRPGGWTSASMVKTGLSANNHALTRRNRARGCRSSPEMLK